MRHPDDPPRLSPADADALDALAEAGFDPARVPPVVRDRAERVAALLGLLDPPAASAPAGASEAVGTMLSPADAAAVDALVNAGWDPAAVEPQHSARARAADRLLSALALTHTDTADDTLLDATLARIHRHDRAATAAALAEPRRRRFGLPSLADLMTAAAVLLIGTSILWPMVAGLRRQQVRTLDAAHLANAGLGFSMYADDHLGALPAADVAAGRAPGVVWWDVGEPGRSHSANLFVLIRQGYATPEDLSSAANPHAPIRMDADAQQDWAAPEQVSFSYQLLGPDAVRWSSPQRQVVLVSRSPVIELARQGVPVDPLMNSLLHRGAGQHVLFNDRSVRWLDSPVTPWGDNLWLPRTLERRLRATLKGVELPAGRDDAFVGP
ncbi:MAG: hypothetical protein D6693_01245 [Planctomycetota bacterium]|nr:MAG: hypothetical protein D6693_01245 [Planctomycetota bacterium]